MSDQDQNPNQNNNNNNDDGDEEMLDQAPGGSDAGDDDDDIVFADDDEMNHLEQMADENEAQMASQMMQQYTDADGMVEVGLDQDGGLIVD